MQRPHSKQPLSQFATLLRQHPKRWIVPAVMIALAATVHATFSSATWEASQGLMVRNEADSTFDALGEFRHVEDLKVTQDTLLQVANSNRVLHGALAAVGPADPNDSAGYPTDEDVVNLRESLRIVPPNGSEFGSTEVLYLKVKDQSKSRAIALANAISEQLQNRSQEIRSDKARSIVNELRQKTSIATADLKTATAELAAVELSVGSDLAELRNLHGSPTSESNLRRDVTAVEAKLRERRSMAREFTQLREVLVAAQQDPLQLVATPNGVLESQPALRRLKDGLVDAQLETAKLRGQMTDAHPKVRVARYAEDEIAQHINAELAIAIRGIDVEQRVTQHHLESLESQHDETHARLERLAGLRSEYSTLIARVEQHTELLKDANRSLTDARAMLASAKDTHLISPLDAADAGTSPVGPTRAFVAMSGLVGGVLVGWGLLFVTVAPATPHESSSSQSGSRSGGTALHHDIEMPRARMSGDENTIAFHSYAQATEPDGRI